MPEGDTVHKVAAALDPLLEGQVLRRVLVGRGPKVGLGNFGDLEGRRVEAVFPKGKHLFLRLEGGILLRTHLGLHGSWHRYRPDEAWRKSESQASLALWTDRDVLVCFHAREVECLRAEGFQSADATSRLGPDLLAPEIDLEEVLRRARELLEPATPLVDVLLDQRVASGIGNVYKSEVLFLEGADPAGGLGDTPDDTLRRLFRTARDLLLRNLGGGPRTTRFEADRRGRLWVYSRRGRPCLRCTTAVQFARFGRGLRATYWCPRCQPAGDPPGIPHPLPEPEHGE